MHGPKRGKAVGTANPCPRRVSPRPHWHVNRGQPFAIGYSTGHGGPTYMVMVHADDEDKLKLNRQNGGFIIKARTLSEPNLT